MTAPDGRPLRVLLTIHHELATGAGAPGSTVALAEALTRRGHDVETVGLELLAHRRGATADAIAFPHAVRRLVHRRLEQGAVDVVDASSGDLAYVSAARVRAAPAAVLTRSHGLEPLVVARRREGARHGELRLRRRYALYHGGVRLREVARSCRVADALLVLNDAEAAFVTASYGVATARVVRTAEVLRELPGPDTTVAGRDVLVLGPASWRKGGDVSVRVLDAVLRADPAATASWLGLDDPDALGARLARDVRERVARSASYGPEALATALAAHRVLLFASRAEGLPVTLLEAMAAGLAVVGTDVPGVVDLLSDGAGVVVPDGHVEGLVGAVRRLLADDGARAVCAAAALERAVGYRADAVVDALVEDYRELVALKRRRR